MYLIIVLRSAWLTDDAYISFRTVDNFVNGYGLTWNTAERVQTFTHPLWVLLVSAIYWVTGEIYYTCIFLSATLGIAALLLIARTLAHSPATALLGILLLTFSKAFVDYSTSGLENPLSHLLLAFFAWILFTRNTDTRKIYLLSLVAGLGAINRMDTLLLFLPGLLHEAWRGKDLGMPAILKSLAAGLAPFILWECFALFYYGFLFPNTAYAKLGTGIPRTELLIQGLHYFKDALYADPLLLPTVSAALGLSLRYYRGPQLALVAGTLLYLTYVMAVGGDFMSSRFLTVPLLAAVILLIRLPLTKPWVVGAACLAAVVGLLGPHPPLLSGATYGQWKPVDRHGITDERAHYYPHAGLLVGWQDQRLRQYKRVRWGLKWREGSALHRTENIGNPSSYYLATSYTIGYAGFYAGPEVHLLGSYGLSDPLLARMPMEQGFAWRIGHFHRSVPDGLVHSLRTGENHITDPALADYYERLMKVTRGRLFSMDRLVEIWHLNTKNYDTALGFVH